MYEIIKNVIKNGEYELGNILTKIDTLWAEEKLTDAQRQELKSLARENADPEQSYAPLRNQIESLFKNMGEMAAELVEVKKQVAALQDGDVEPSEPTEPAEEYPEYVPPTGAHDAYHAGDKMTFNKKKYTCIAPEGVAVVWNPDVMPSYWRLDE